MKKIRAFFENVRPIYVIFFLFGVFFLAIGLIVSVPSLNENAKLDRIAKTGTAAVAFNLQKRETGLTVNDVEYYYIEFEYEAGLRTKTGKTSSSFTESEANEIVSAGTLNIRYTYEGTVEENFDVKKANKPFFVVMSICCAVGGVIIVVCVIRIIFSTKSSINISKHGVETRAYEIYYKSNESVNDVKYYRLYASYTNQRGEYVEGKTQKSYTLEQAEELVKNKTPLIRYYGETFEIVPEKETKSDEENGEKQTEQNKPNAE